MGLAGYDVPRRGRGILVLKWSMEMRMLLGFSLALLIAAGMAAFANDGSPVEPRIIRAAAANAANPNCPQGNNYRDGCLRAHAGTPQNPHLLDIYGVHRPPWNVAGVDYPTGYTGALSDPATSLPACAEYVPPGGSGFNGVDVVSTPCTLDHLDFSLHGSTCLQIDPAVTGGGRLTVTNSHFKAGPNECQGSAGLISVRGPVDLVAEYNTFDGADADGNYDQNIDNAVYTNNSAGNQTFEFNTFLHCPQACLTFAQTGNINIHYNYVQGIDVGGFHGDLFVINNFYTQQITETLNASFDTVYLDSTSGMNMTALCYLTSAGSPFPPPAGFSGGCRNETYIARAGHNVGGTPIRLYPVGTQGPFTITSNYIDPMDFASSSQIISSSNADGTSNSVTCSGNINMLDGTTIPVTLYPGTAQFFTCN